MYELSDLRGSPSTQQSTPSNRMDSGKFESAFRVCFIFLYVQQHVLNFSLEALWIPSSYEVFAYSSTPNYRRAWSGIDDQIGP